MNVSKSRTRKRWACLLAALSVLSGCSFYNKAEKRMCARRTPDPYLLRQSDMADFMAQCGLTNYADASGKVHLHYLPPRGDGTIPVEANAAFAVSEPGGAHGRVWYLCMPVPKLVSASSPTGTPTITTTEAVCRYAGSGMNRTSLVQDADDARTHDPRNW